MVRGILRRQGVLVGLGAVAVCLALLIPSALSPPLEARAALEGEALLLDETLKQYCVTCHNPRLQTAELSLQGLDLEEIGAHAEIWEGVVRKLRTRSMPPVGRPRPENDTYDRLAVWLEDEIDRAAFPAVDPGRTEAFHRLNRAEYANAVRDLLGLEVDVAELLPADNFDEHGFDNMASVLTVSSSLLERYLSAARKIARLAVGETPSGPATSTYRVPILYVQDDRVSELLPFGSRGGIGIEHYFPVDGEYDLEVTLHRNYVNYVRGMGSRHELQVRLDGRLVRTFTFGGTEPDVLQAPASYGGNQFGDPEWEEYMLFADANLRVRFEAEAGPRVVSVSFVRRHTEPEGVQQPRQSIFAVSVNEMRDGNAAVDQVVIGGPYESRGPGDTLSRRVVFSCTPESVGEEEPCAREILRRLARRAYRRPVGEADLVPLLQFYRAGREGGSFDGGLQLALERLLISPDFLFRIERDPTGVTPGERYKLTDLELASRLSFFLWSSGPDDELLNLAEAGRLQDLAVLETQARRMLADSRASALVANFAGQWLRLRDLGSVVPDAIVFPDFDENLREAFQQETELFIESLLREDRSVLDLVGADYTFANERLARHYGIPNVYGSQFRRIELDGETAERRGGIIGHGSVLTVTSYPNRTSPVLRGKWILNNILGTPPPPPPDDVPDLPDRGEDGNPATVRERLQRHRESPVCSTCHAPMDPLGLAMENYDAVGQWRTTGEATLPIDSSGTLPDGTAFDGPDGLRSLLLERGDQFVATVTEKLLAYAIGRGPEYYDRPTVREIVRQTAVDDHRWSSVIVNIVKSGPFRMRRTES
jgi:hypothetical protein